MHTLIEILTLTIVEKMEPLTTKLRGGVPTNEKRFCC